jgi:hypothetical protein
MSKDYKATYFISCRSKNTKGPKTGQLQEWTASGVDSEVGATCMSRSESGENL